MRCSKCRSDNPAGKKFCAACGTALVVLCAKCASENSASSQFCGDCGSPLSISPRQWIRHFGLYQRTMGHPRRNVIFFTTLATALLSIILPSLILGNPRYLFSEIGGLLGVFVFPPIIATYALWVTYPRGRLIYVFFIAVFWEYFGLVLLALVRFKLSTMPGFH